MSTLDTIAAIATPTGIGGIGVIRISGAQAKNIAEKITNIKLKPRYAHFAKFTDHNDNLIDEGLVIWFPNPHSFTGEDVIELQGHGGPFVLNQVLQCTLQHGARMARPGEFSERAFLNDKMDLTQAEAIADLIEATSSQAARNAIRSLQGDFSKQIQSLVEKLIHLRMYVEAAIDFPEEEIDFLSDGKVAKDLDEIISELETVQAKAKQGVIMREGMRLVIAGKPNVGKSSLLNHLSERDSAIITDIPGTTRDILREDIQIDDVPIHLIDTAGLRDTPDVVEREGVRRAWDEIKNADHILLLVDASKNQQRDPSKLWPEFMDQFNEKPKLTVVFNKIDLLEQPIEDDNSDFPMLSVSIKQGIGIDKLKQHIKNLSGLDQSIEGQFSARQRHLQALDLAHQHTLNGKQQLHHHSAGELLAEDLRHAQNTLNEITGEFHADDLLGRIFSSFCIGK